MGSVDVCVVVFNPGASDALEAKINFNIQAQSGTAGESVFAIGSRYATVLLLSLSLSPPPPSGF